MATFPYQTPHNLLHLKSQKLEAVDAVGNSGAVDAVGNSGAVDAVGNSGAVDAVGNSVLSFCLKEYIAF